MAKTRFYTGTGDQGETSRLGGQTRIKKSGALIDALGAIDEATSNIGTARAVAQSMDLCAILPSIQRHIITLMAHLSATPETRQRYPGLGEDEVAWLEGAIAKFEKLILPLKDFVLPGNSTAGAAFHVARTVVRRAERKLVALSEAEPGIGQANLAYLNRLSSLLFVGALIEDNLSAADIPCPGKNID